MALSHPGRDRQPAQQSRCDADGYVTCKPAGADAMIGIDPDAAGSAVSRNLVLLKNQGCAVAVPGNFVF